MNTRLTTTIFLTALLVLTGCGGGEKPADKAPTTTETAPPKEAKPEPSTAPGPTGTATISGVVTYEGEVPALKTVKMDADPGCAKLHTSPVKSEMLVLGDGNTLGNVFVRVSSGLPGGSYPPPGEAARMKALAGESDVSADETQLLMELGYIEPDGGH